MKPLVIYHGGECTDGFGAAFAAWLKFGDEAEYLPMNYLKATDGVAEFHERVKIDCSISEREVYILDFSLPKVVMDWLFGHAKRVVWLDHHKTAFEMWLGNMPQHGQYVLGTGHTIWLDNNKSGAMLAWEYFHPGTEVPMLIRHIDDRYRWQFKLGGSKEFHAANPAAISELLDRLEATEKELAELRSSMEFRTSLIGQTEAERDALRAKIEKTEKQEPVAKVHVHQTGGNAGIAWSVAPLNDFDALPLMRDGSKLYALPGAQNVPSVPEVTDAMIEVIESRAEQSYRRHHGGTRGQQSVPADALSWHIIHATRKVLSEAPEAKP